MVTKDTKKKEPQVAVFGEEVGTKKYDKGGGDVVWGALFILAGIILLLNTMGIVPWEIWQQIAQFWPVLVILVGLQVILGHNTFSRLIILLVSFTVLGTILLSVLQQVSPQLVPVLPDNVQQLVDFWKGIRS